MQLEAVGSEGATYTVKRSEFGWVNVCPECLCLDIEWEDWVDVQTGQPTGGGTGADHVYCQGCAEVTGDGIQERGIETVKRGTVGVWVMPPSSWFDSDAAWAEQIERLHAFGVAAREAQR